MREGSPDELQIEILPQFLPIKHHFVREGSPDALQIAILPQFLAIEPHFVRAGRFANCNFTSVFGDRTTFRAKRLHSNKRKSKSQFYFSFWRSNQISCEKVALGQAQIKIAILFQCLAIKLHFVRKGCHGNREISILPQFLTIEPRFMQKGCARTPEIVILLQLLAIELHFARKGCVSCLQERNRKEGEREGERERARARGQERM